MSEFELSEANRSEFIDLLHEHRIRENIITNDLINVAYNFKGNYVISEIIEEFPVKVFTTANIELLKSIMPYFTDLGLYEIIYNVNIKTIVKKGEQGIFKHLNKNLLIFVNSTHLTTRDKRIKMFTILYLYTNVKEIDICCIDDRDKRAVSNEYELGISGNAWCIMHEMAKSGISNYSNKDFDGHPVIKAYKKSIPNE